MEKGEGAKEERKFEKLERGDESKRTIRTKVENEEKVETRREVQRKLTRARSERNEGRSEETE
jgi:hypothetical protein